MTLSPPIKILALVGVIAIVAFGASTMLLGKSASNTHTSTAQPLSGRKVHHVPAAAVTTPAHTAAKPHVAAKTTKPTKTHATPTPTKPAKVATKTHAKPAVKHARPTPRGNLVYEDLPKALQVQLALHRVVVVSLYNPNAGVDAISVAEAHAGAIAAGAGFLLVSVLDDKVAGMLTALLPGGGLLPDPGVLVYRAPGDIMVRLDGFADRMTVEQAVTNALAAPKTIAQPTATTASPTQTIPVPGTTGAP